MDNEHNQYEMIDPDKRPHDVGGIESMPMSSAHPTGAYRDIPIVWLTGSLVVQMIVMVVLYMLFHSAGPLIMAAFAMLAAIIIWRWNEQRGMARASTGWRIFSAAFIFFIAAIWALPAISALD